MLGKYEICEYNWETWMQFINQILKTTEKHLTDTPIKRKWTYKSIFKSVKLDKMFRVIISHLINLTFKNNYSLLNNV